MPRCPKGSRRNKKTGLCESNQTVAPMKITNTLPAAAAAVSNTHFTQKLDSINSEIKILRLKNKSLEDEKQMTDLMIKKNNDNIKALEKEQLNVMKMMNAAKKNAAKKSPVRVAPRPKVVKTVRIHSPVHHNVTRKASPPSGGLMPYTKERNDRMIMGADGVRTGPMRHMKGRSADYYVTLLQGLGNDMELVAKMQDSKVKEVLLVFPDELQDYITRNAAVGDEVSMSTYQDVVEDTEFDYEDELTPTGERNLDILRVHRARRLYCFDKNYFDGHTHQYLGSQEDPIEKLLSKMAGQF